MNKNEFGCFIKEKRLGRGYTQKELADILFIDTTAVSKWERGVSYPDITLIPDICKALDVTEHELIESSNDTEYRLVKSEAEKYTKLKNGIFFSFAIAYVAAVLVCFIVNISVSHTLSWFFIVLASCLCGFSFMPSVTRFFKKFKLTVYGLSTFISLFLLFLTCSIYTGNFWVWTAISGTAIGYFAIFYPIAFVRQKSYVTENTYAKRKKYFLLTYFAGLFLLTVLLLFLIGGLVKYDLNLALRITAYCYSIAFIWGIAELFSIPRLCKLGIDFIFTGIYFYVLSGVLNVLITGKLNDCYKTDFSNWTECTNGNVAVITAGSFAAVGIALIISGIVIKNKKHNQ